MPIKPNRQNISEYLLEYQLSLIGKTVKDAIEIGDWKKAWYFPKEDAEKFRIYSIPLIKKVFKCNRKKAEDTLNWFNLQFGLKTR